MANMAHLADESSHQTLQGRENELVCQLLAVEDSEKSHKKIVKDMEEKNARELTAVKEQHVPEPKGKQAQGDAHLTDIKAQHTKEMMTLEQMNPERRNAKQKKIETIRKQNVDLKVVKAHCADEAAANKASLEQAYSDLQQQMGVDRAQGGNMRAGKAQHANEATANKSG